MKRILVMVLLAILLVLSGCSKEKDNLDQSIIMLEDQLATANERITQLEIELTEKNEKYKILEYEMKNNEELIKNLTDEVESAENQIEDLEKKSKSLEYDLGDIDWRHDEQINYYLGQIEEFERLYANHPALNDIYHIEIVKPLLLDSEKLALTVEMADGTNTTCILDEDCNLVAAGTETLVYADLSTTIDFLDSIIESKHSYTIEILYSIDETTEIIRVHRVKMN